MSAKNYEQMSGASDPAETATIVEAVAVWCECMSGAAPLRSGLRLLADCLDASAVAISRVRKDGSGTANTVIHDRHTRAEGGIVLNRSYAEIVLGRYFGKSKSGTLWYSSMLDGMVDPALKQFQQRRRLHELVILPLCVADRHVDFIELHFSDRLDPERLGLLNMAASTFVKTWAKRANGLFVDASLSRTHTRMPVQNDAPLLDLSNPANLSRCEYRVCLLLSNGLHNDAIQREMSITPSTLRTHLRNIYNKTDCGSLAELTYKLLSKPVEHQLASVFGARIA